METKCWQTDRQMDGRRTTDRHSKFGGYNNTPPLFVWRGIINRTEQNRREYFYLTNHGPFFVTMKQNKRIKTHLWWSIKAKKLTIMWSDFTWWKKLEYPQELMLFVYLLSQCMTKLTKWPVHPAKTPISLGIRPVWSESSLSAWRKLGSIATR